MPASARTTRGCPAHTSHVTHSRMSDSSTNQESGPSGNRLLLAADGEEDDDNSEEEEAKEQICVSGI